MGQMVSAAFDEDREQGIIRARDQLGEAAFAEAPAYGREFRVHDVLRSTRLAITYR